MTDTDRFIRYAIEFEKALATDDWSALEPLFTEDAVHHVKGGGPFSVLSLGRDEVLANLRRSVDSIDRRFDRRLPEVIAGPEERDGAVWITFRATFEREGLEPLIVEGNHATRFEGGRISRIDEGISRADGERAALYLRKHEAHLLPPRTGSGTESAVLGSGTENAGSYDSVRHHARTAAQHARTTAQHADTAPNAARMRDLIAGYAAAKSRADVNGALAFCHDDFFIETVSFGLTSRDKADTADQLRGFFAVFPDYDVRVAASDIAFGEGIATCHGTAAMTMKGDFGPIAATGARADLPIFCVFTFRDGLLASERFFFDLATLCRGIQVPVERIQATLAMLRDAQAAAAAAAATATATAPASAAPTATATASATATVADAAAA